MLDIEALARELKLGSQWEDEVDVFARVARVTRTSPQDRAMLNAAVSSLVFYGLAERRIDENRRSQYRRAVPVPLRPPAAPQRPTVTFTPTGPHIVPDLREPVPVPWP